MQNGQSTEMLATQKLLARIVASETTADGFLEKMHQHYRTSGREQREELFLALVMHAFTLAKMPK